MDRPVIEFDTTMLRLFNDALKDPEQRLSGVAIRNGLDSPTQFVELQFIGRGDAEIIFSWPIQMVREE